jgi:Ca-activated chloride channel family protein
MSDETDALKAALKAASPTPDAQARAEALRLAMENFDRVQASAQGSAGPARLPDDRPAHGAGFKGVWKMLKSLSRRPVLTGATSAAALFAVALVVTPLIQQGPRLSLPTGAPDLAQPRQTAALPPATGGAADKSAAAEAPLAEANMDAVSAAAPQADAPVAGTAGIGVLGGSTQNRDLLAGALLPPAPAPAASAPPLADLGLALGTVRRSEVPAVALPPDADTEAFANAAPNPLHVTADDPVSTFAAEVDTAAWAVVRSSLNAGALPPPEAVRIEEMVNYFPYAYPVPTGDAPFAADIAVMPTPWNPGTQLVRIGLQGALPAVADRPALNLVFLIDTSGSMDEPNKLPLLKQSLRLMLPSLRAEDRVAIVTYAGSAGEVLPPTPASDRAAIEAALERLDAGGSTAGAEGIALAYQVAQGMARDGAVSRVLLATDGDFNVGLSGPEELQAMIAEERASGTYLSVLGFGRGNLDDATMQALAQNGNGTASYIDTLSEAQKVLGDQLTGALFPIADDVKIQVEWNPATVAEYRLIGYETRALRREDFGNDRVDAGEVGAGLQVTALYEVTAPGSPALKTDPLRYGPKVQAEGTNELGFLRLRWKAPGEAASRLAETPITGLEAADDDARFAAAVAGFGQLLQGSVYLGDWGWDQAIALAAGAKGEDAYGYRAEAVGLMRLAQSLSPR